MPQLLIRCLYFLSIVVSLVGTIQIISSVDATKGWVILVGGGVLLILALLYEDRK